MTTKLLYNVGEFRPYDVGDEFLDSKVNHFEEGKNDKKLVGIRSKNNVKQQDSKEHNPNNLKTNLISTPKIS